jgi:hypothetical protein
MGSFVKLARRAVETDAPGAMDVMSLAQVSDHNLLDLVVQRVCVL